MRIQSNIFHKIALFVSLLIYSGCAQNNVAVKSDDLNSPATGALKEVKVTGDGDNARIVISADRPVSYTFYKTSEPLKAVVDLAQIDAGAVQSPIEINAGNIKRIETNKHGSGAATMTRVEVFLSKDRELVATTDANDKGMLSLSFVSPPGEASTVRDGVPQEAAKPASVPAAAETRNLPESSTGTPSSATAETTSPQDAKASSTASATAIQSEAKPVPHDANGGDTVLKSISASKDAVEIAVTNEVANYKSFKLTKPDRLVVDLFGVKSAMPAKVVPLNSLGVGTARIGTYPEKVRIVFDAAGDVFPSYRVDKTDTGLKIVFTGLPAEAARTEAVPVKREEPVSAKPAETVPKAVEKKTAQSKTSSVESLDFTVKDNLSRITLTLGGTCNVDKPVLSAEGVTLDVRNCSLPKRLQRQLDTSAFAGVVQRVTPYQVRVKGRNDVKIQVKLRTQAPFELKREGDVVHLDFTNPPGLEAPAETPKVAVAKPREAIQDKPVVATTAVVSGGDKKTYTGRRVTLEFSDADIRKIFQLIAEVSNLNFLIGDDVTGTISIKLVNVPWDQALDVILENKGLGMQRDGNIVQIRPKAKIQTLADEEQATKKATERAMELKTEIFDVNFATIGDVVTQFTALKSERGSITPDTRTNKVIVKDIAPNIADMKALLKSLDAPEMQVMIEARIVEASSTFTQDLGVQWGVHARNVSGTAGITNVDSGFGGILTSLAPTALGAAFGPGAAAGIAFGKFISGGSLDLKLSAAASAELIKIISSPKVVTLNNKAAKISQGQSIPYQTVSAEGTKTEFVEAALTLEVTPHITADGSVIMKIKATNNSAGTGSPPPINKKEATTELLVKNGETTVIGGIFVDSDTDRDDGVPFLKDIPLLGHMFKSTSKTKQKTELLIFITPKIVS